MRFASALVLAAALPFAAPAHAGEQTLEYTLVTHAIECKEAKTPNIDNRSFLSCNNYGVAFFTDGRVAAKDFVVSGEVVDGKESDKGLSTYHFTDGSTLSLSFVGGVKDGAYHGDYTVLSGTGIYAGATGSGVFDSLPTKWKSASFLFKVKVNVKTPGA